MYSTETIPLLMLYWHHCYWILNGPRVLPNLEEKYRILFLEWLISVTQQSHRYLGIVRCFRLVDEALPRWSLTTYCALLTLPPLPSPPPYRPAVLSYHSSPVSLAVSYLHYFAHTVTSACIPVSCLSPWISFQASPFPWSLPLLHLSSHSIPDTDFYNNT